MVRRMQTKPMARSEGLLVEHIADETVVYDAETKEAHCLSPLAAAVFERCDGRTSLDELLAAVSGRMGEPVDADQLVEALAQLQERNLLAPPRASGFSRRELFRRSATVGAAAMAVPLITTVVAPTPAAAVTPGCGPLTCCPCFEGQPNANSQAGFAPGFPITNGQDCCDGPRGTTVDTTPPNCNCVNATEGTPPCGKQCKGTGAAVDSRTCVQITGNPNALPTNASTICRCATCA